MAKGNWLYDAVGTTWMTVPRPPDAIEEMAPFSSENRTPACVDSAGGGSLLVWGGSRWEGKHAADGAAQLFGDGWRLVIAGATR